MEFLTPRILSLAHGRLTLLLLIAATCAACGGKQVIEGRPPFVGISAMSQAGGQLTTGFRVDNQNGVPMNIQSIDITVSLGDIQLTKSNRELQLAIDANSAEEIQVEDRPPDEALESLESLQRGETNSLPFRLVGRVRTQEDGYLRFEQKGHLYPVPGRPGFFRSAATQAQELRRDEKL
jgi:LEA14-like dessication related protein